MSAYNNLPNIDEGDEFISDNFHQYLAQRQSELAADFDQQAAAPLYHEVDYGYAPHVQDYAHVEYDAPAVQDVEFREARQRRRYMTPELEDQQGTNERSFDGPDVYTSTDDNHHYAQEERPTGIAALGLSRAADSRRTIATDFSDDSKGDTLNDEKEGVRLHYGDAPKIQLRRNRTKKRVALTAGNLVVDAPIPSRLAGFLPRKGQEEFDKMRCVC